MGCACRVEELLAEVEAAGEIEAVLQPCDLIASHFDGLLLQVDAIDQQGLISSD